ncbi:MAG TPA: type I methionyl aminopeptidase [Candidatus Limnocylindria bacterium]|nr:type I methionyl aminopeptidase [Candidatus Limnocylindria bacterium]
MITRKSARELEKMRRAGRVVAEVLALIESELKPGVTTGHLDALAERHIRASGAVPSFLGYLGGGRYGKGPSAFPASTCISIDSEVVHGIPGNRTVKDGSIVSVDVGAIVEGWHGDAARTFVVGDVPEATRALVDATRLAMMAGIGAAKAGARVGDISAAVEDIGRAGGYGIVEPFVGHGIGTEMHQDPQVPNYRTGRRGPQLQPGMCLAIEPMFTLGTGEVYVAADGWTVATRDDVLAAHFEHTIAITPNGPEILTTI